MGHEIQACDETTASATTKAGTASAACQWSLSISADHVSLLDLDAVHERSVFVRSQLITGLYFLFDDTELVYLGQTTRLPHRLGDQFAFSRKARHRKRRLEGAEEARRHRQYGNGLPTAAGDPVRS